MMVSFSCMAGYCLDIIAILVQLQFGCRSTACILVGQRGYHHTRFGPCQLFIGCILVTDSLGDSWAQWFNNGWLVAVMQAATQ